MRGSKPNKKDGRLISDARLESPERSPRNMRQSQGLHIEAWSGDVVMERMTKTVILVLLSVLIVSSFFFFDDESSADPIQGSTLDGKYNFSVSEDQEGKNTLQVESSELKTVYSVNNNVITINSEESISGSSNIYIVKNTSGNVWTVNDRSIPADAKEIYLIGKYTLDGVDLENRILRADVIGIGTFANTTNGVAFTLKAVTTDENSLVKFHFGDQSSVLIQQKGIKGKIQIQNFQVGDKGTNINKNSQIRFNSATAQKTQSYNKIADYLGSCTTEYVAKVSNNMATDIGELAKLTSVATNWKIDVIDETGNLVCLVSQNSKCYVVGSSVKSNPDTITIPSGVTTIGKSSDITLGARNYSGVKTLEISNTVTNIEKDAVKGWADLTTINFETGGTSDISLAGTWISNCTKVTSLELPSRLTKLNTSMSLSKLQTVTFAENSQLQELGSNVFGITKYDPSLQVTVPLDNLKSVTLPTNANVQYNFTGQGDVYKLSEDSKLLYKYSESELLEILMLTDITGSLQLDEGIQQIPNNAFVNKSMTSVVIPESCKSIGEGAFKDCSLLNTVTFADTSVLESIGNGAFNGCIALASVVLPESLIDIAPHAFDNTAISSIVIPSSVKYVGENAFSTCSNLTTVTIQSKDLTLYDRAFGSGAVTSVSFTGGDGVYDLRNGFGGCTSLESIVLPEGTKSFWFNSNGAIGLKSINIPASLFSLDETVDFGYGAQSMMAMPALSSITVSEGNEKYTAFNGLLFKKIVGSSETTYQLVAIPMALTEVEIPAQTSSIWYDGQRDNPFASHENIVKITVKSGASVNFGNDMLRYLYVEQLIFEDDVQLDSIGSYAFASTNLIVVSNLPKTITSIGSGAFSSCFNLQSITFETGSLLQSLPNDFASGCTSLTTVSLPGTISSMSASSFRECSHLSNVTISGGTSLVYDSGSFVAGNTLSYVTSGANQIRIGKDVDSIRDGALADSKASVIILADSNTTYECVNSILMSNGTVVLVPNGMRHVVIPEQATAIGAGVFTYSKATSIEWYPTCNITLSSDVLKGVNISELKIVSENDITIESGAFNSSNIANMEISCNKLSSGPSSIKGKVVASIQCSQFDPLSSTSGSLNGKQGMFGSEISRLVITSSTLTEGDVSGFFIDSEYGDVTVILNRDGTEILMDFVKIITGKQVVITSEIGGFQWYLEKVSASSITFGFLSSDNLATNDVVVTMGEQEIVATGIHYVVPIEGDLTISISERAVGEDLVTLTFVYGNGIDNKIVSVAPNRTIRKAVIDEASAQVLEGMAFVNWYADSKLSKIYDGGVITENTFVYAKWYPVNGLTITYDSKPGLSVTLADGTFVTSGDRFTTGTSIKFTYDPVPGFEFRYWSNGDGANLGSDSEYNLTLTENTTINALIRYYSTSNQLINKVYSDMPTGDIVQLWKYKGVIDTSMNTWTGLPSIPLIIDDSVYTRVNDDLLRIDINTGNIIGKVSTTSSTVVAYYHYLGYGGGLIFDYSTDMIYDSELEVNGSMDKDYSAVFYDSGYYYGICGGKVYKFAVINNGNSLTIDQQTNDSWANGVDTKWHSIYGTTSSPVFENGHIYFIEADGESRIISSISESDGSKTTYSSEQWDGRLMDDGWLTYYENGDNKYLFTTMYNQGLFDSSGNYNTWIVCIPLNQDGTVGNTHRYLNLNDCGFETGGAASAFIIHNGRGYVNTSSIFFTIDVGNYLAAPTENNRIANTANIVIWTETSKVSHGSIVLNVSEFDLTGKVYAYLLPYFPNDQAVYIFEDYEGKISGTGYYRTSPAGESYGSQAVRVGPNGQLVWYTDSGYLYCYGYESMNNFEFFIDYGDVAMWLESTGADQYDALLNALDAIHIPYSSNTMLGMTSINNVTNNESLIWNAYGLVDGEWILFDLVADNSSSHTYMIYYGSDLKTDKRWTYMDGQSLKSYSLSSGYSEDLLHMELSSLELRASGLSVSGNKVEGTINIINKNVDFVPHLDVYTKFLDKSQMKIEVDVCLIDGLASVRIAVTGNSVPYLMEISLKDKDGNQLIELSDIDLTGLMKI